MQESPELLTQGLKLIPTFQPVRWGWQSMRRTYPLCDCFSGVAPVIQKAKRPAIKPAFSLLLRSFAFAPEHALKYTLSFPKIKRNRKYFYSCCILKYFLLHCMLHCIVHFLFQYLFTPDNPLSAKLNICTSDV